MQRASSPGLPRSVYQCPHKHKINSGFASSRSELGKSASTSTSTQRGSWQPQWRRSRPRRITARRLFHGLSCYVAYVAATSYQTRARTSSKRKISDALSSVVSPALLSAPTESNDAKALGGKGRGTALLCTAILCMCLRAFARAISVIPADSNANVSITQREIGLGEWSRFGLSEQLASGVSFGTCGESWILRPNLV